MNIRSSSVSRLFRRKAKKAGLPPGTIEYTGDQPKTEVKIEVIDYDAEQIKEETPGRIGDCLHYRDTKNVSWINITGVYDADMLQQLGGSFKLHPLVLEDIVNTHQRAKLEDYGDYVYIVLRMLGYDKASNQVLDEQISIILGDNYVISIQEYHGGVFDNVRKRIREGKGRIRSMGPDYLAYALLDAVIDHYFVILEKYGEQFEELEENLVGDPNPELLQKIHHLKREMIVLRKSVWPLREVVSTLERGESRLIGTSIQVFLRDAYDHTIQVIDAVESFRDMVSGMQDLYLSSISNKMNEVMKVLTIIATIFVPLTFVAGIYGMNFEIIPELKWKLGYLFFWIIILAIGGLMFRFFRKKRWL